MRFLLPLIVAFLCLFFASPCFAGDLIITEFSPCPPTGEQEWVEIFNQGFQPVDISGWKIDDIEGGSSPVALPENSISPGGYFLFTLTRSVFNNTGQDQVRLLDLSNTPVDYIDYQDCLREHSYSRIWDNVHSLYLNEWWWSNNPSPENANPNISVTIVPTATTTPDISISPTPSSFTEEVSVSGIWLSEFMACPSGVGEWVELYNSNLFPVDLSTWALDDGEGGSAKYTFPAGTVVAGNNLVVIEVLGRGMFNNGGDVVELINNLNEVSDYFLYSICSSEWSWARASLDKNSEWAQTATITRGRENYIQAWRAPEASITVTPPLITSKITPTLTPTNSPVTLPSVSPNSKSSAVLGTSKVAVTPSNISYAPVALNSYLDAKNSNKYFNDQASAEISPNQNDQVSSRGGKFNFWLIIPISLGAVSLICVLMVLRSSSVKS